MTLPSRFSAATTFDVPAGQDLCAIANAITDEAVARKMRNPALPLFIVMGEHHTVAEHQALQILTLHALKARNYNVALSMELTHENMYARVNKDPLTLQAAMEKTYSAGYFDRTLVRSARSSDVPVYLNDALTYSGGEGNYLDSHDPDTGAAMTRADVGELRDYIDSLGKIGMQIRDDVMARRAIQQAAAHNYDFMIVNCGTEHVSGTTNLTIYPEQSYDFGVTGMLEANGANVFPIHLGVLNMTEEQTAALFRLDTLSPADRTLIITTMNDRSTLQKTLSALSIFENHNARPAPGDTADIDYQ